MRSHIKLLAVSRTVRAERHIYNTLLSMVGKEVEWLAMRSHIKLLAVSRTVRAERHIYNTLLLMAYWYVLFSKQPVTIIYQKKIGCKSIRQSDILPMHRLVKLDIFLFYNYIFFW